MTKNALKGFRATLTARVAELERLTLQRNGIRAASEGALAVSNLGGGPDSRAHLCIDAAVGMGDRRAATDVRVGGCHPTRLPQTQSGFRFTGCLNSV